MYPDMFNRDDIFFRLGNEKLDDLLQKLREIKNPDFHDDKEMNNIVKKYCK